MLDIAFRSVHGVRGPREAVTGVLGCAARVPLVRKKLTQRTQNSVTVIFCGISTIRALNFRYRNVRKPTDVLSFSYPFSRRDSQHGDSVFLGEIFICVPIARRQAREYGHSMRAEIELLVVHGLLHILGFDHTTRSGARKMRIIENKILRRTVSRTEH